MELTEFAEISEYTSILTPEEKMSIFYYLATKTKGSQLMFSAERREFGDEIWIERTVTRVDSNWYEPPLVDAIDFTVNQDILLTVIGLYTALDRDGYDAVVEVLQSTKHLFKMTSQFPALEMKTRLKFLWTNLYSWKRSPVFGFSGV